MILLSNTYNEILKFRVIKITNSVTFYMKPKFESVKAAFDGILSALFQLILTTVNTIIVI